MEEGKHTRKWPCTLVRLVAAAQGVVYVVTGVWPLVSIDTFQAVTGPKTDLWLVRTVGLLVTIVGAALLLAAARRRIGAEVALLAIGCAASLAAIDVIYATIGRIAPVYYLDAIGEIGLVVLWCVGLIGGRVLSRSASRPA